MTGPDLELAVGGQTLRFPALWLRDNCPCPDCVAPGTTQKVNDITDIPNGLAVTLTEDAGESVVLTFAPDQHRAVFSRSWLAGHAPGRHGDGDGRTEDDKELWLAADLAPDTGRFPRASWAPAGLLRRPGRPGQHAGRPQARGEAMTGVEAIAELFAGPGARDYLGEPVTIGEHMRQAGALAEAAGAAAPLVAAALLHDVGHLLDDPRASADSRHGTGGARWLSQWFGAGVTEPVRLHVAAKRYLCATEPG